MHAKVPDGGDGTDPPGRGGGDRPHGAAQRVVGDAGQKQGVDVLGGAGQRADRGIGPAVLGGQFYPGIQADRVE
ncbi:hypothetical protein [Streptomyces tendae]|uniref:hypothetical protein n=1 Tax=Streptomyces tendae TaxID=1932 RepID=UPI00369ABBD3